MTRLCALLVLPLALGACKPTDPDAPSNDVTCPDGTLRPQIDCSQDVGLKGKVVDANASLGKIGLGLGARYEEGAVGQVTDSTYQLALQLESLCKDYNACVMDPAGYQSASHDIRRRLADHVQLVGRLEGASAQAGDAVWANARPDLASTRISVDYRVEAVKAGTTQALVHRSGDRLVAGDGFRVIVRPSVAAHVYVLLLSSQGEASVLYPDARMGMKNPAAAGSEIAIPPDGLFVLDTAPGTESVHVLVSQTPLVDLEARLAALKSGAARPSGVLEDVGNLLCPPGGTRGVTYTKTAASCEGKTHRGVVYRKSETPRVVATPGDDVVVIQHALEHG
ncbi:MAG: DUF4384 domain-containing protein [Nannocystaceae bacterium]|nr:DUF4384 domain-containing protein [bacterium]